MGCVYVIMGCVHKWFKSHSSNRVQYTKIDISNSSRKHITHGISHGSIRGPLLFIIYINYISKCSKLLCSSAFNEIIECHKVYHNLIRN